MADTHFNDNPAVHQHWMTLALAQAQQALTLSDPNPRVGCVLVNDDQQCIGMGFTQAVGGPHAEVMALRHAQENGNSIQGATAYVTLEPCSHYGRTPPCSQALIQAGVKTVVIAAVDPNPQVCGQGIAQLEQAGITVHTGIMAQQSEELNIGFFSRMKRKRPWVRLKLACSLDGKTALNNGQSQWITSEAARADGHHFRARASAILTGIGTILTDDPMLNVRAIEVQKQPWHVILDTHLQTPPQAQIFKNAGQKLIYTLNTDQTKYGQLQQAGATVLKAVLANDNRMDLSWVLHNLAQYECNELHIEAGATLSASFLKAGLVDELLIYIAPRLIGRGQELLPTLEINTLAQTLDYHFNDVQRVGDDLRLLLRQKTNHINPL